MIKKHYIFINEEGKIFILVNESSRKEHIHLPNLMNGRLYCRELIRYIVGFSILNQDWQMIQKIENNKKRFYVENGRLIPYINFIEEHYYMKQGRLLSEQIRGIMECCYHLKLRPEFLCIEELLSICKDEELDISYEENLPKVLTKVVMESKRQANL